MPGMTREPLTRQAVHQRLAELVEASTDGQVDAGAAERAPSLILVGVDSLASLRLIDAVEREFGIPLAVEDDAAFLDSVAGLAGYLFEHGLGAPDPRAVGER
jgi:acyl carrier protein